MAVDFAEILFLAAIQHAVAADERKAEKKAEVDDGSSGHEQRHGASNPGLAYEPGDERSRGGDKGSSAGGEEPEHRCRWGKIHIADVRVTHEAISRGNNVLCLTKLKRAKKKPFSPRGYGGSTLPSDRDTGLRR